MIWRTPSNFLACAALLILVASPAPACTGDCDGSCDVTVEEIVTLITIAMTGGAESCTAGDADGSGAIDVAEIVTATRELVHGCSCWPAPDCGDGYIESGEDCDDGGTCVRGTHAGVPCIDDRDCGLNEMGVCVDGEDEGQDCFADSDCRDSMCRRCRPVGGDGCSATCTAER